MAATDPSFDEPALEAVERAFERLLATGELQGELATAEDVRRSALPRRAGPVLTRLSRRFRCIRLPIADVTFHLHEGQEQPDGTWRMRAEPAELDISLCRAEAPDLVVDSTRWPGSGDQDAVHSSFFHFVVRAAIGDGV